MKFVLDESVDFPIVNAIRNSGFEVREIAHSNPGAPDEEVLSIAEEEDAIVITSDKDFGELCIRRKKGSKGVILLRLPGMSNEDRCSIVTRMINMHINEIENSFSVVTKDKVRIRKSL